MFLERRYEDSRWKTLRSDFFNNIETVHLWHLYIQKKEIDRSITQRIQRFFAVSTFSNNRYIFVVLKHGTKQVPGKRLIIHKKDFQLHTVASSNGIWIVT